MHRNYIIGQMNIAITKQPRWFYYYGERKGRILASWINHTLITSVPYCDCKMPEKSQSEGNIVIPSLKYCMVGELC